MTDRIYPSSKPNTTNPPPSFPTTKSQLYGATRPVYRPQPKPQPRRRRSCCCACFLWTSLFLIAILLLLAIAAAALWVIYRPHHPTFSLTSLTISSFNLTQHLDSTVDLRVSARNPNKKLVFYYDPISVSVLSNGVDVADGSFPSFDHGTKNTTLLKTSATSRGRNLDSASAGSLKSDLKLKSGLPLEIRIETKVRVKMGSVKTRRVGIRVSCDGINAVVPKGKTKSAVSPDTECKVKLRVKIWKWHI